MKALSRDGVRLCYAEAGRGDPPIVFVHGWCCDHTYFQPQFEHFVSRHRVVALDQRGFGESDKREQEYTIEGFADDLHWMARELGLERPTLVGHSMGGAVVLAAAANYPDLANAIVLCDPAVVQPEGTGDLLRSLLEELKSEDYREKAREFITSRLFSPSDDPVRREEIVAGMTATPQHVLVSAMAAIGSFDSEGAAARCKVPTLLIDAEVRICDRDRLRELCPQLTTGQTVGAGHFHQLEVPEQVNAMVEAFLRAKVS